MSFSMAFVFKVNYLVNDVKIQPEAGQNKSIRRMPLIIEQNTERNGYSVLPVKKGISPKVKIFFCTFGSGIL